MALDGETKKAIRQDDSNLIRQLLGLCNNASGRNESLNDDSDLGCLNREVIPSLRDALHFSCEVDAVSCFSYLLGEFLSLEVSEAKPNESGTELLRIAAISGSEKCLKYLLSMEINRQNLCCEHKTVVLAAIENLRKNVLEKGCTGAEAIISAVQELNLNCLKFLLRGIEDVPGLALNIALAHSVEDLAIILAAAESSILEKCIAVSNDEEKGTLLELMVKAILRDGSNSADIADVVSIKKSSILKNLEFVLLWKNRIWPAQENIQSEIQSDSIGHLLLLAGQAADVPVLTLLLEVGADPNFSDGNGNTALHLSLLSNRRDKVSRVCWLLMQGGASVLQGNKLEVSPVHLAAGQGHLGSLKIFLAQAPCGVGMVSVMRETPLFWAVRSRHIECAKILLFFGADVFAYNVRKQRPFDIADTSEMRCLLQEGVKDCSLEELKCSDLEGPSQDRLLEVMNLHRERILMQTSKEFHAVAGSSKIHPEMSVNSVRALTNPKTELCRYFMMAGGCVRGDGCLFAHGQHELHSLSASKAGHSASMPGTSLFQRSDGETTRRKIFVGGLSPSVESGDLWSFFEARFGPVVDAVVIGSQTAEHTFASRGFGFVTFRFDQSFAAAIREHYVILLGKKVEIKSAVPRPALQEIERRDLHNLEQRTGQLLQSEAGQGSLQHDENSTVTGNFRSGKEVIVQTGNALVASANSPGAAPCQDTQAPLHPIPLTHGPRPSWLLKLRQWLPNFLSAAVSRLGEGEYYPLSSLKGDFRATCGLELDHLSVGYPKLSDFVRSLHDICRMKIVPVGRGPATHMILLPLGKK